MGFEPEIADDVRETPTPSDEIVDIIRTRIDPEGIFLSATR